MAGRGGDYVCHHDGVGHIETEVVTHAIFHTSVYECHKVECVITALVRSECGMFVMGWM